MFRFLIQGNCISEYKYLCFTLPFGAFCRLQSFTGDADDVCFLVGMAWDGGTASGAHLLRLYPGGIHFIVKFADVRQEHAMMCALMEMNRRWQEHSVNVCGVPVQALTYEIFPIGSCGGLIEAVIGCRTLRELKRLCRSEPQERVYEALAGDGQKLNTLAASTTAYLTACYSLGVRDGHDDNIMLRDSLFSALQYVILFLMPEKTKICDVSMKEQVMVNLCFLSKNHQERKLPIAVLRLYRMSCKTC